MQLAEEYLNAAKTLHPVPPNVSFVCYFLYGHALELTLKAFLISQGATSRKLKRIGHNLERAVCAAAEHQPFQRVPLSERDRTIIAWIGEYYKDKEFEYLITGYRSIPNPDEVRELCERVQRDVKPLIREATLAHIASGASPRSRA